MKIQPTQTYGTRWRWFFLFSFFIYFLIENKLFSHSIHSNHSFPSLYSSKLPTAFLHPRCTPLPFPIQKEKPPRADSQIGQNEIQYDEVKNPYNESGQGNSIRRKDSQEQTTKSWTFRYYRLCVLLLQSRAQVKSQVHK